MTNIKRSNRSLSPEKIRELAAVAKRVDADEADAIRVRGRIAFRQHDQLRSLIDALKSQRQRQGLSLADIAHRSGIGKPNLSRLENSRQTTPTLDTLQRYAQALGKAVRLELADAA